jgi:hypothetical protein
LKLFVVEHVCDNDENGYGIFMKLDIIKEEDDESVG